MRLSPTLTFVACLVLGLFPALDLVLPADVSVPFADPWSHFGVSLLSIIIYGASVWRTLARRRSDNGVFDSELIDSIYFLGFLQTMGVLASAFKSGTARDDLLAAVGAGVLLTLFGLAFRVGFTLQFGGGAIVEGRGTVGETQVHSGGSLQQMLSADQLAALNESLGRVVTASKRMASQVEAIVDTANGSIKAISSTIVELNDLTRDMHAHSTQVGDAVRDFGTNIRSTLDEAFVKAGALFINSADKFQSNIERAEGSLRTALNTAVARQEDFGRLIQGNLEAARATTRRIDELSAQELRGLEGVATRISKLSDEVRQTIDRIPDPTGVVVKSLRDLAGSTDQVSRSLAVSSEASEAAAERFRQISETSAQVAPALRELEPSIREATGHLRAELKEMNALLDQFVELSRRRISGERR